MALKNRWLALVGLTISVLVIGFDLTILNVALPTMAADIGADTGQLQWIVDSYAVVYASAMLPAGLLGDRFGRRKLLVTGLAIFLGGSVLGALVSTPGPVIVARTIMGVGAALIMPLTMSVVPTLFKGAEQTKAIAIITVGLSIGLPLGPLVGGWLLEHFWWGSVFVINIPLVVVGIIACLALVPETRDPSAPTIDPVSTVLGILGLGALIYGVIEAPNEGLTDPVIAGSLIGGLAMLIALAARERRQSHPMMDIGLLKNPAVRWNTLVGTLGMFTFTGLLFVLPQYLQAVQGHDAFGTGLRLMPLMAGLIFVARAVPPLTARFGTRPLVIAGLVLMGASMLVGSTTDADTGYGFTALWMTFTGLGAGFVMVPALDSALAALPKAKAGTGSSLMNTLRQVGGSVGIAVLGSVLNAVFTDRLDTSGVPAQAADAAEESIVAAQGVAEKLNLARLAESAESAFTHGVTVVLLVCAVAALATALLSFFVLPDDRKARQAAAEETPADTRVAEGTPADTTDTPSVPQVAKGAR
ncbi:EmrB/QacA subfamily drug resistance transporter [Streptomyces sp. TLI_55]|uniref:MFS transporter n=1 Tax=Streptomyces sp. TLI_55 TaxID=1938861 RepID=UPI000BCBC350|nr:MFS transporter [Streptomyces sp. TLI_55]SNX88207.1 EmrB/QacA subfamily drug resistance transporter [Streptomyces sp. TLI_55]